MKSYFNIISITICGFNLFVYSLFFFGIDLVPDEVVFPLIITGSIIGFILSGFGTKGVTRNIGIFGHIFVLLFTIVGPLIVGTFIWNEP